MSEVDGMLNTIHLDTPINGNYFDAPRVLVNPDEKWIKHVHCNHSRVHVLSWIGHSTPPYHNITSVETRCSEPDCIYNKPLAELADFDRRES